MSSPLGLLDKVNGMRYNESGGYHSLFNNNKFYYRPVSVGKSAAINKGVSNSANKQKKDFDLYDTSLTSIIDYTSSIKSMKLKATDFMYLRDYGRYPNNRLMVIRRFRYGVDNDLAAVDIEPISTIISWIPEGSEIMSFTFGEEWSAANPKDPIALFDTIFKSAIGTTVGGGFSGMGDAATKVVPLGGVSEALQFKMLELLGVKGDAKWNNLPSGNPNFITDAKMRGELKSDIEFKVETVYEQKFFGKVDPSIVFLDLMNNILRFGSSESVFYITGATPGSKIDDITKAFARGDWAVGAGMLIGAFVSAIKGMVSGMKDDLVQLKNKLENTYFQQKKQNDSTQSAIDKSKQNTANGAGTTATNEKLDVLNGFKKVIDDSLNLLGTIVIAKYRIQIASVINTMTGRASTPWHITIGNPKKPIFSSGDMYISDNVKVDLGEVLAYNDLPNTIKITFTLRSARSLGIQELFERFNVGGARVSAKQAYKVNDNFKDFFESPVNSVDSNGRKKDGFSEAYTKAANEPTKITKQ